MHHHLALEQSVLFAFAEAVVSPVSHRKPPDPALCTLSADIASCGKYLPVLKSLVAVFVYPGYEFLIRREYDPDLMLFIKRRESGIEGFKPDQLRILLKEPS